MPIFTNFVMLILINFFPLKINFDRPNFQPLLLVEPDINGIIGRFLKNLE